MRTPGARDTTAEGRSSSTRPDGADSIAVAGSDSLEIPDHLAPFFTVDGSDVALSGDDTGMSELYFTLQDGRVSACSRLAPLLDRMSTKGESTGVSAAGVSHLLHDGILPLPYSVYEGVYRLGPGDRASVTRSGSAARCDFRTDFPYYGRLSRQDNTADTRRLLDLLTVSLERQLTSGGNAMLMLSSGKDSSSIALAAAELGRRDISCVTYSAGDHDDEHAWAARTCQRLGLKHERITLTADERGFDELLGRYFTKLVTPWVDPATLPYLLCLSRAGLDGGDLVDGSGNDIYMGYLLSPEDRLKMRLSVGRFPSVAARAKTLIPHYTKLSYLLRNRAEIGFGGRFFRHTDTRRFFDQSFDTTYSWSTDCKRYRDLDDIDFRALMRGRHYEQGAVMGKVRAAARHFNARPAHPFIDADLIEYYFNLPESERFDRQRRVNKLLLRKMLAEYLDYDAVAVGKRYFQFDGPLFVHRYRQLIVNEVSSCRLWNERMGTLLDGWLAKSDQHPYLWQSIVALLQISAWHNHSRFAPRG